MTGPFDSALIALLTKEWTPRQLLIFDWYDGPIDGLCQPTDSEVCLHFSSLAEQWHGGPVHERLFGLRRVRDSAIREVQIAYGVTSQPAEQVCSAPPYRSEAERLAVEAVLEDLIGTSSPTRVAIRSSDMLSVLDIWILNGHATP